MSYSKYTTLVSGYTADPAGRPAFPNRAECSSDEEYAQAARANEAWSKKHFQSTRRAGICKPETCLKMAAKLGLTHNIKAEAASFDQSGKGRNSLRRIAL